MTESAPIPISLKLRRRSRRLEVSFSDGKTFDLSAEYLRVHSPSAEVQGHAAGEGLLVVGKERVNIDRIEPVGRYAVRLVFDDGHDTGLYTWPILYRLGSKYRANWQRYLDRLRKAGHQRAAAEDGGERQ
ncbi:MAG: gamma-butyrobetaine hydroxylase-like domain-containing protein [Rhodospirillaceae bacterium]|nr:gamma-butyrobetaine hydroxylase-like domain-containing protein [Rhodospirillaceae bacterium]